MKLILITQLTIELKKMKTLSIIFIVLAVLAISINIIQWVHTGKNQLSEIIWICSAIIWCLNNYFNNLSSLDN